jgi:carbamoyl-phosphate synthase small subunit
VKRRCYLVLRDGSVYPGEEFGAQAPDIEELRKGSDDAPVGEVVFNTGMIGYQEILTDPSYAGQIVVMTYPMIGNYGVDPAWNETGIENGIVRKTIKAEGFVVRRLYRGPIPGGRMSLDEFLREHSVAGIAEVDTRKLTLRLRDKGSPNGIIVRNSADADDFNKKCTKKVLDYLKSFPEMEGRGLVDRVGTVNAVTLNREGSPHIALVDCGVKSGILKRLDELGARVSLLPGTVSSGEILNLKPDAALFSNGPGDPAVLNAQIDCIRDLFGRLPVFGICLGHQLIALALGAKTYKLKFGHHGVNNPVIDVKTSRVFVTSQNHGFAVEEKSLPKDVDVWFKNANDGTVEGLTHRSLPVMCVQFHPEACPGPEDTRWIFGEFMKRL